MSSDFFLGKTQKPPRIKGFYEFGGRAARLAKTRRALLGPSFTSCRLGENGVRPARFDPVGPRPMARLIAARLACALARLARCPVALRWRRAVRPSCGPR